MPASAVILLFSGIHADVFTGLVPKYGPALDVALTLFWVVGITAAFSILDHMDGLYEPETYFERLQESVLQTLGILALVGIAPMTLILVALLSLGAVGMLAGSLIGGTMLSALHG